MTILSLAAALQLAATCAPSVAPATLLSVVRTESNFDALSVGDNSTHRSYSPATLAEAVALSQRLIAAGHNLDLGIGQINQPSGHLQRRGLSVADAFDPCTSLRVGSEVLGSAGAARATRRGFASIVAEALALRRGPGKLTSSEYFSYRVWDPSLTRAERLAFVGKQAQERMHRACNEMAWLAPAADKLLFHTVMTGAGFDTAELLAVVHPSRALPGVPGLRSHDAVTAFLRDPAYYPLFAKPIAGKYSLDVLSADEACPSSDKVTMLGGEQMRVEDLADRLLAGHGGFLLQRRLSPPPEWVRDFGWGLCSVRVIIHLKATGPSIHRAVLKLATGNNPADNFWRSGNMLGAVDVDVGWVDRVVTGTGLDMEVNAPHPDTGTPIAGIMISDWHCLTSLVEAASQLFPGIRTQSWDIAITDHGMVPLEVNWGGDLNLAQLAHGAGVLDDDYRRHLRLCGYPVSES